MPLMPQLIPIKFTDGINQKVDSKTLEIPTLLELINGVKKKQNRISKRFGYDILSTEIEGGGNIEAGEALGIFQDELNLYTGTKLYSYSSAIRKWKDKGNIVSVIAETKPLIRNNYQQSNISSNTIDNVSIYAWEDSRGGVRYSVYDQSDGTILVNDESIEATGARPRILTFGSYFLIFYTKSSDTSLRYRLIAKTTPTSIGISTAVTADMNAVPNYDCVTIGTKIFFVYYDDTSTISLRTIDEDFAVSSVTVITGTASRALAIISDESQNAWIAWSDGTDVRVTVRNFIITELLAPTVLEAASGDVINITGTVSETIGTFWYEVTNADTSKHLISTNTMTLAGLAGTAAMFKRSVGLASKAFVYNDVSYIGTIYESTYQASYFVISEDGSIVAKLNHNVGGVLVNNNCLTEVSVISDTTFLFSAQVKTRLESENNVLFSLKGVSSSTLDFSNNNKFQNAELGQLLIAGAVLQSYDGVSVNEHGFNLYPENLSSQILNHGGSMADGTYQYTGTYEWTDNLGEIHRSAPSTPAHSVVIATPSNKTWTNANVSTGSDTITITAHGFYTGMQFRVTTAGTLPTPLVVATDYYVIKVDDNTIKVATSYANAVAGTAINLTAAGSGTSTVVVTVAGTSSVIVTFPTLRLTAKTQVRCVLYRTESLGLEFRRVTSVTSPTLSDPTVDSVTFTDTNSDASIISNDLIYVTGGILENIAPPACSLITTYKDRMFLLDEDGVLWYSKKWAKGYPVEFNDSLVINPSAAGGRVKGLGVIDSNFILQKLQKVESFAGEGPDDTGNGVDYGAPQEVTSDTGGDNPNSIASTADGLVFKSPKGLYQINRSLQSNYIGANVEDYNDLLITSSASLPKANQIRFVTDDNIAMIYDYFFNQWSTFSNHSAQDTAIWNNKFLMLRSNGEVWQESDSYQDGDQAIPLTVTTGWISLAGLQGFQRIWRMFVMGEYKSPHKLRVSVGYDFNTEYEQVAIVDVNDVYIISTWGEEGPWGVEPPVWGGEFPFYGFEFHLTRQKCTSIRFKFEDDQNSLESFGEGLNLSSITLQIGLKQGLNKMQSKNRFGTEAA